MRILIVHNHYQQKGGEDIVVEQEMQMLIDFGHEVAIYRRSNEEIEKYGLLGKASMLWRSTWSTESNKQFEKKVEVFQPDIVHIHNTHYMISPSVYYMCKKHNIPVVQTLHNYRLLCPNGLFYRDEKVCEDCMGKFVPYPGIVHKCFRDSVLHTTVVASTISIHRILKSWQDEVTRFVVLTDFARDKFIEGGLPPEKLVVKPNFLAKDPGVVVDKGNPYFVFVGRLSSEKGVTKLLEAAQRTPDIPIKIIGYGPLEDDVKATIEQDNLDHIEFLGKRSHQETISIVQRSSSVILTMVRGVSDDNC